jgi:hypothetical protein
MSLFSNAADWTPDFGERLMKGIDASFAETDIWSAEKRLAKTREYLAKAEAEKPPSEHHIHKWRERVMDMEAALETYNRRLGEAKIKAGFVS